MRTWWATPGGGLEADETFEAAAAREALEELSLLDPVLTSAWYQTVEFDFQGEPIRQLEHYSAIRVQDGDWCAGALGETHRREHCGGALVVGR